MDLRASEVLVAWQVSLVLLWVGIKGREHDLRVASLLTIERHVMGCLHDRLVDFAEEEALAVVVVARALRKRLRSGRRRVQTAVARADLAVHGGRVLITSLLFVPLCLVVELA